MNFGHLHAFSDDVWKDHSNPGLEAQGLLTRRPLVSCVIDVSDAVVTLFLVSQGKEFRGKVQTV